MKLSPLARASLAFALLYLFFAFGVAPLTGLVTGVRAPLPSSLVLLYTAMSALAILLYFSTDDERWRTFIAPLAAFASDRRPAAVARRRAVLVLLPLAVGVLTYRRASSGPEPPVDPPGIHFNLPARYADLVNPLPWSAENVFEGGVLYMRNCAMCHGAALDGQGVFARAWQPRPANFRDSGTISQVDESYLFWRIREGAHALPSQSMGYRSTMPSWKGALSDEEIWKIVAFEYTSAGARPARRTEGGTPAVPAAPAPATDGRAIYQERCVFCHGEKGRGDGPSAADMMPAPRDFTRAEYKVRSTGPGRLPTRADLVRAIARGLPDTSMPAWDGVLDAARIDAVAAYVESFSPRFSTQERDALVVPDTSADAKRGGDVYREARCFLCHGEAGRGNGELTNALFATWGLPHPARDLTQGWTFKGGHEPRDVYLRITGGLPGTPMGAYQELLTDQQRWDLAHHVVSLDRDAASPDFVVAAAWTDGEIPGAGDPAWNAAPAVAVPLGSAALLDPASSAERWWQPSARQATLRALWNGREAAVLAAWNDPTEPGGPDTGLVDTVADTVVDTALLQFAQSPGGRPRLLGDDAVDRRPWNSRDGERSTWEDGRWRVVFERPLPFGGLSEPGVFLPFLLSVRDGANGELGEKRAISTWLYLTLERPSPLRTWLLVLNAVLAAVLAEVILLRRWQR